jgi:hypothetical protein
MTLQERIESYERLTGFPKGLFIGGDGRIAGIWIMGNNYTVKSKFYGGYPAGYLRRVKALFPDKRTVLHLFSGKVDTNVVPGLTVDINPANSPEVLDDAHTLDWNDTLDKKYACDCIGEPTEGLTICARRGMERRCSTRLQDLGLSGPRRCSRAGKNR